VFFYKQLFGLSLELLNLECNLSLLLHAFELLIISSRKGTFSLLWIFEPQKLLILAY